MSMAKQYTMTVSLTKQLDAYVKAKVKSGEYASASEVMRESLRYTQERDRRVGRPRNVAEKIRDGVSSAAEGRLLDGPTAMEKQRARLVRQFSGASRKVA